MDDALLSAWHGAAARYLDPSVAVWDAHTHVGDDDPDGFANNGEDLLRRLNAAGHAGAVVCSSMNPRGYRDANDRVLAEARESRGRMISFLRVDPRTGDATAEVERSLDAGHRGIKLHPRAEEFSLDMGAVDLIAEIAAEWRVPVLVHAGRGIPSLGRAAVDLCDRYEQLILILAHCGISDLSWLAVEAADRTRILFDTAWWNPADLAALFAWVDASRILYASDTPYGDPVLSFTRTMRALVQAGLPDGARAAVFGGNLQRALQGEAGEAIGVGREPIVDAALLRVASYLLAAVGAMLAGGDPGESIDLAMAACRTPDSAHRGLLAAVAETLVAVRRLDPDRWRARFGLLLVAAAAVHTPAAGFPELTSA